jgi:hypothetical protein
LSGYVVIRFPLLSLSPAIVGDNFDAQIGTRHRRLVMLLRILALVFFVTGAILVPWKGLDTVVELLFVGYAVVMIPVLVWLLFAYDSVSSPIVATLSRSTFGIGIVAFPLYLPLLFIGAMRCLRSIARRREFRLPDLSSPSRREGETEGRMKQGRHAHRMRIAAQPLLSRPVSRSNSPGMRPGRETTSYRGR